jgi:hypothetical protein
MGRSATSSWQKKKGIISIGNKPGPPNSNPHFKIFFTVNWGYNPFYGYGIFVEEKVLIRELCNSYAEYMKRTKRVIPYLA